MLVSIEKPGSPSEVLEHFGTKGMHWGVRKQRSSSSTARTPMSKKKKVAIGVGILGVAAGAGFVAYKLHKNGKLPLSRASKMYKHTPVVHPPRIKIAPKADIIRPEIAKRESDFLMNAAREAGRKAAAGEAVDWVAVFKKNNPGILK